MKDDVAQPKLGLILTEQERVAGFVRPIRRSYLHDTCGKQTSMGVATAEEWAKNPDLYSAANCVHCGKWLPAAEFQWLDGTRLGS